MQDVRDERQSAVGSVIRDFPPDARSVREVRTFVRQAFGDESDAASRAVMIASELAGNAVLHAGTPYAVSLVRTDRGWRGEVADGDRHRPTIGRGHGHGGRGLLIVDAMADRWGVHGTHDRQGHQTGKVVWFEIDVPEATRPGTDHGLRGQARG